MQQLFPKTNPTPLLLAILLMATTPTIASAKVDANHYQLHFEIDLTRTDGFAKARISVAQDTNLLREVRLRSPASRYSDFSADGTMHRDGTVVVWRPPAVGGSIDYVVQINHQRNGRGFDALITDRSAVFRGDNVFPPASITQQTGARASSEFSAQLPKGWSLVTPFAAGEDGQWLLDNPDRNFDRPIGWLIAGKLGVRRDVIADTRVSVAGPIGAGVRRVGMLALLRWTMPLLLSEIESRPPRINIVSAGNPMWRGGLSAPNSLYLHADRPLLSENGTSTLVHEITHLLMPVLTAAEDDWIDEGIAEYVTLEILRRSDTISEKRFRASLAQFRRRGKNVDSLSARHASGAITARAVTIFHSVDSELQSLTDGRIDIFDLIRTLMKHRKPVGLTDLRTETAKLTGGKTLQALDNQQVPGFDSR